MVVVLIIGILIAIALPTFLGARERAADRAAQSDLRTGLAAALTHCAEAGDCDGFDATVAGDHGSRAWTGSTAATQPHGRQISIQVHAGTRHRAAPDRASGSGTYFCLAQVPDSPAT